MANDLRVFAEYCEGAAMRAVDMFKRECYVFRRFPRDIIKNPPTSDAERWEAVAFSLYCDIAEINARAVRALNDADYEALEIERLRKLYVEPANEQAIADMQRRFLEEARKIHNEGTK